MAKNRVRELREAMDLSMEGLAYKTGLSKTAISNIESGRADPRASTLQKIAKVLGVTLDEIYRRPEKAAAV